MARPYKPEGLNVGDKTKANKQARYDNESALRPRNSLPMKAPARIENNPVAAAAWRKLMRLYSEIDAEIVTRLDFNLLEDYCLAIDETEELRNMRTVAYQVWLDLAAEVKVMKDQKMQDEAAYVAVKTVDAFDAIIKLDARIDRKRDLIHRLSQSLYLTPRARAGVSPNRKDREPEKKSEMESLLSEFEGIVNGVR